MGEIEESGKQVTKKKKKEKEVKEIKKEVVLPHR